MMIMIMHFQVRMTVKREEQVMAGRVVVAGGGVVAGKGFVVKEGVVAGKGVVVVAEEGVVAGKRVVVVAEEEVVEVVVTWERVIVEDGETAVMMSEFWLITVILFYLQNVLPSSSEFKATQQVVYQQKVYLHLLVQLALLGVLRGKQYRFRFSSYSLQLAFWN